MIPDKTKILKWSFLSVAFLALAGAALYFSGDMKIFQGLLTPFGGGNQSVENLYEAGPQMKELEKYISVNSNTKSFLNDEITMGGTLKFSVIESGVDVKFAVAEGYGGLTITEMPTAEPDTGGLHPGYESNDFDTINFENELIKKPNTQIPDYNFSADDFGIDGDMTTDIIEELLQGGTENFDQTNIDEIINLGQEAFTQVGWDAFEQEGIDGAFEIGLGAFTKQGLDALLDGGIDSLSAEGLSMAEDLGFVLDSATIETPVQTQGSKSLINRGININQGVVNQDLGGVDFGFDSVLQTSLLGSGEISGVGSSVTNVTAKRGDKVTLTTSNKPGADIVTITVYDKNGKEIEKGKFNLVTEQLPVTLKANGTKIVEGGAAISELIAEVDNAAYGDLKVYLDFAGTAQSNDYTKTPKQDYILIKQGATSGKLTIGATALDDDAMDETLNVSIKSIEQAEYLKYVAEKSASAVSIAIQDKDEKQTISLSVDKTSIEENGTAKVKAALPSGVNALSAITVKLSFIGGTAQTADYNVSSQTVTISKGGNFGEMSITAVDDTTKESDETVKVSISEIQNPSYAKGSPDNVTITIKDNDTTTTPPTEPVCGNDEIEGTEYCDDSHCNNQCTACVTGYVLNPVTKLCEAAADDDDDITPPTGTQCLDIDLLVPQDTWNNDDFTATKEQKVQISVTTSPADKAADFNYKWEVNSAAGGTWQHGAITEGTLINYLQNISATDLSSITVTAVDKTSGAKVSDLCVLTKQFVNTDTTEETTEEEETVDTTKETNYWVNKECIADNPDGKVYKDAEDMDNEELCNAIGWVTDAGVFEGYENGEFKPNKAINRVELFKVMMIAFEVPEDDARLWFSDIDEDEWYIPYLETAVGNKIVNGDQGKDTVRPDDKINRVETLKLIFQSMRVSLDYEIDECDEAPYSDTEDNKWYTKYVCLNDDYDELFDVDGKKFMPAENATRGETALVLYRLHNAGEF